MISVKDAIASGAWYHCQSDRGFDDVSFRIGILSFEKQRLSEKDLKQYFDEGGNLWLMKIQVVSLNKTRELEAGDIYHFIYLQDQDGFQFKYLESPSDDICSDERWEKRLKRFGRYSGSNFQPKTKAVGSIAFFLPDDDDPEYYIGIEDGTIAEV